MSDPQLPIGPEEVFAEIHDDIARGRPGDLGSKGLAARFIAERRAEREFQRFARSAGWGRRHDEHHTEVRLINVTEPLLAGVFGAAALVCRPSKPTRPQVCPFRVSSPHFAPPTYCGAPSARVYYVAVGPGAQRSVSYASAPRLSRAL